MICPRCNFENLSGSGFCQECGYELSKHHTSPQSTQHKTKLYEELDDVIFKPKKKSNLLQNLIVGIAWTVAIVMVFVVGIAIFSDSSETSGDALVLPTEVPALTSFPLTSLGIEEVDSEWIGETFYLNGILKNSYSRGAQNIRLRVDFYKDEATTKLFDTRYVTLTGVSAQGAYSFSEPVYINNPTSNNFWYLVTITDAEFLE